MSDVLYVYLFGIGIRLVYGLVHVVKYDVNIEYIMAMSIIWPLTLIRVIIALSYKKENNQSQNSQSQNQDVEINIPTLRGFELGTSAWKKSCQKFKN
jgi:hypothetical protein